MNIYMNGIKQFANGGNAEQLHKMLRSARMLRVLKLMESGHIDSVYIC